MRIRVLNSCSTLLIVTALTALGSRVVPAQSPTFPGLPTAPKIDGPWMNPKLSPEDRADLVLKQLTLDEKIALLHGNGMAHTPNWQTPLTDLANGGAGYVEGVKRLGIPGLVISDAAYGVRDSRRQRPLLHRAAFRASAPLRAGTPIPPASTAPSSAASCARRVST